MSDTSLFPIIVNERWGYMNGEGQVMIEPTFLLADEFYEGLASFAVQMPKKGAQPAGRWVNLQWGFINPQGVEIVAPHYDHVRKFAEGRCAVRRGKKWGFD